MRKINVLLTVTALLSTTSLWAAERSILDLQFIPNEGTFYSNTELGYNMGQIKDADLDINQLGFVQTFGYSFMDESFLTLDLGFQSTSFKPDGGDSSSNKGLTDVTLGYTHRMMDNSVDGSNWDIVAAITPKLGTAKTFEGEEDGNAFSGQTSIEVGTVWGKKMGQNSFKVDAGITWNTKRTTETADTEVETEEKASFDFGIGGAYQYDFNAQHAINASLDLDMMGVRKADGSDVETEKKGLVPTIGIGYDYAMSETMKIGADAGYTWFTNDAEGADQKFSAYGITGNFTAIF